MVQGFGFRGPNYQGLQPMGRPQAPVWGPPDVSQQLQSGIGSLGEKFGQAYKGANEFANTSAYADKLLSLQGKGGIYGGGGGGSLQGGGGGPLQGGTGAPDERPAPSSRSIPSFAQMPNHGLTPELGGLFEKTSQKYQLPADYLPGTAFIESKFNPNAKNPKSSAGGLFQQIDSNWQAYGDPTTSKFDPIASTEAAAKFASENRQYLLKTLGREPTSGELYLAHQQGPAGAAKLLANPNARAVDLLGEKAVRLNGGNADMSAGAFAQRWTSKFPSAAPPQAVQQQVAQQTSTVDPRTSRMTQAEIVAEDQKAGRTPPPMATAAQLQGGGGQNGLVGSDQLQPKPQDQATAAAVVTNDQQTKQATQAQAAQKPAQSFMGLPTAQPSPAGPMPNAGPIRTMPGDNGAVPATAVGGDTSFDYQMPPGTEGPAPAPQVAQQAPAPQPTSQPAPQPQQQAPAPIQGGGGSPALQGGTGPQYGTVGAGGGAFSRDDALQLAALAARSGNPQLVAQANSLLGEAGIGAGGKPVTQEVGGVLYQMDPQTRRWIPVAGQQKRNVTTSTVNGRLIEYNQDTGQTRDVTPQGMPQGARPMTPAEKEAFGLPPSVGGYMDAEGKPHTLGQPGVQITNTPENKGAVKQAEVNSTIIGERIKTDAAARDTALEVQPRLNELGEIFARAGTPGGWAELKAQYGSVLQGLGFDVNSLSDAQTAQAIVNYLAPRSRVAGTGTLSDTDMKSLLQSLPKLSQDPETRGKLLGLLGAGAERDIKLGELADKWLAGGYESYQDYVKERNAIPTQQKLFDQFKKDYAPQWNESKRDAGLRRDDGDISKLQKKEAAAAGGVPSFPSLAAAEKAGLKPGDRFKVGNKTYEAFE